MSQDTTHLKTARTRRLTIAAAVVFALAGGAVGGSAYLQSRAPRMTSMAGFNEPKRPWQDPKIEKGLRDARVAKALRMREQFRPWALKHKGLIQTMLQSKGKDEASAAAVLNALPFLPEKTGIPRHEFRTTKPPFSWAGLPGSDSISDPGLASRIAETAKRQRDFSRKEFIERHDLSISDSVHAGPSKVLFWVTGRVTEEGIVPNPSPTPGDPAFVDAPPKQLAPPYEFLKS